jgi:exopolyphosphatase/guanosine-5'-triphosphate,3'-diphosphate pyrophosphatase
VPTPATTFGAIDVGTNAVRLKVVRPRRDGSLEVVHEERDAIRPGEGVFETGSMPPATAARLIETLRRYAAICRETHAEVRAVATSALREADNGPLIVERVASEAGVRLEVISGREEARLICLGVLAGTPARARSLVVDIGGGSTEIAVAVGETPRRLYSLALGAVRLTEIFGSSGGVPPRRLAVMRDYAREVVERGLPRRMEAPHAAIGSSGSIRAVVGFAASRGTAHASAAQVARAVDDIAAMTPAARRRRFDPARAEIIVAGAVVLEAVARHLDLASIAATDRGLRDGLLLDLARRHRPGEAGRRLHGAAIAVGRTMRFDEAHARKVAEIALVIHDAVAGPGGAGDARARRYLEVAALLHDAGHAIGYQRHHKHAAYIIQHADMPGLTDRERDLISRIARFHRRSEPSLTHSGMEGLSRAEALLVRRLATILRVADALDRSHHQPVRAVRAALRDRALVLRLEPTGPLELELWDVGHDLALFRRVFGRRLIVEPARIRPSREAARRRGAASAPPARRAEAPRRRGRAGDR